MTCGTYQTKGLRVHHIHSWEENADQRFDVENAATMCDVCHDSEFSGSFHDTYGDYDNNLEQFIEFYEERTGYEFSEDLLFT